MATLRVLEEAIIFHEECERLLIPFYLKNQLLRAASSVCLNLGEGAAKPTAKDQVRFYSIAFGSLRESQIALRLSKKANGEIFKRSDSIAAMLYRLIKSRQ